jgi:hypothetical protein
LTSSETQLILVRGGDFSGGEHAREDEMIQAKKIFRFPVFLILLSAAVLSAADLRAQQKPGEQISERDQWTADLDFLAKELPAIPTPR